jgi:thiol-disulfide isomerase/thioredoxin
MKTKFLIAITAASLLLWAQPGLGAEPSEAAKDLKELVSKIQVKLKQGDRTEDKLAAELEEFDALLAKHKGEKTDDVAQILYMKAQLYSEVLRNKAKRDELLGQLKKEFPDSKAVAMVKQQEEAMKIQDSLVEGKQFPGFDEKDIQGKPFNLTAYKGKVVLIDFWATWCGPCVAELPKVMKAYEKHHAKGFEIAGISLDSDKAKLEKFTKDKKMTWAQFFDGQGWKNKLAAKYGVNSIPATYLLDGEGKIIAKNLRGDALEEAVAKALAKK